MINVSSSVSSVAGNRSLALESIVSGQKVSVGSASPKVFTPTEVKSFGKGDEQQSVKVDEALLVDAVKKINAFIAPTSASIQFSVDTDSNRTVVKVVDLETKEVIRQYPNEDVLAMSKALDKLQGLMVKQTA